MDFGVKMVRKGHICFELTTWGLGSQGMPRSTLRENVSVHLTNRSGFIQKVSLIDITRDGAARRISCSGSTRISENLSISYVSDKLSKHHGL